MIKSVFDIYRRSFTGLSRETWLLSTVVFINRCGFMAVSFMSLYITQFLHYRASDAGIIITLFGAGSIGGAAAGGILTDKIGYRYVQIFAQIAGGVFFLFFATISRFSILCFLALIISFFTEAFRPANFAAIAAYARNGTETRSYSLNRLAINLGWGIGSSLGGILASINYRLLFVAEGSVNIIGGLFILSFLPARKADKHTRLKPTVKPLQRPWHDTVFVRFVLITTLFATCFFLMFRIGPLFFKDSWKISESAIGLILGLNGVIIALFEMIMVNRLENRKAPLQYAIIGTIFIGVAFLILSISGFPAIISAFLSITLFTIGEMFAVPFINTFVVGRANETNRGQYAAGYTLCWSVAQVIGPICGFYLAQRFGYSFLWLSLCILLLICALAYRVLHNKTKIQKNSDYQKFGDAQNFDF